MPDEKHPDREARIRAEVERAVAPYVGNVPPFVLAKLRELAERYWREHPEASRILDLVEKRQRPHSGTEAVGLPDDDQAETGARRA